MIIFNGIVNKRNVSQILFKNENGETATITVPKKIAELFELGLAHIADVNVGVVERSNDEDAE